MLSLARPAALALSGSIVLACGAGTPPPAPAPPPPAAVDSPPPPPLDAGSSDSDASPSPPARPPIASKPVPVPGATPPLSFDYLAADRHAGRVYLPVANTGSLDVFDTSIGTFTRVDGFKTAEKDWKGKKRTLGPSAVAVGDGVVYVGNRATSEVCVVDTQTWKLGKCLALPTPTDGVAYVAATKEVWVTTPHAQSLTVLDASKPADLKPKMQIKLDGDVEGYAVDEAHGLFFTNLEDKGSSLEVDVKTHKLKASWNPGCGKDGPRGVAVDSARGLLFVACTDHVQVLDAAHDGASLAKLDTGAGVDNLDYVAESGLLYVGAGRDAKLTVARFDDHGGATVIATASTAAGARNAVADANGNGYVPDPATASLLVVSTGASTGTQ